MLGPSFNERLWEFSTCFIIYHAEILRKKEKKVNRRARKRDIKTKKQKKEKTSKKPKQGKEKKVKVQRKK